MIKKGYKPFLACMLVPLILSACGTKKLGTPTGIDIVPEDNSQINYGHTFKVKTYITYSKGGRKEITGKSGLSIHVKGAAVNNDERIEVTAYPTSFIGDTVYVEADYEKKNLNFSTKKAIPFNYKGDLNLIFNGSSGQDGAVGSDGNTALFFRHGKDGDDGTAGGNGENGHDLSVHIYKDTTSGFYMVRVMDVVSTHLYYYRYKDIGYAIKLFSNGGRGGNGGAGGDGGNGKDGVDNEKKTKEAGDGGNGGNGGNGGMGGNGGTAYIFVHPSAADITSKITLMNLGGMPGDGGAAGKAGKAGNALEGQVTKENGTPGIPGNPGGGGLQGQAITVSIEEFDIDF